MKREHDSHGTIDIYPEIDCHIPQAAQIADEKFPDASIKGFNKKWSTLFHKTMDKILVREGLRVI